MIPMAIDKGDSKCHLVSESLDSDKENQRMNEATQLELVTTTPSKGECQKVRKKKWRKG